MSGKTGIQWTDITWNPVTGCTRVSDGCDHCYAFTLHDQRFLAWRRGTMPNAAPQYHVPFSRVQLLPQRLHDPHTWRGHKRVFVNSMSDLFHDAIHDEYIERVFEVMSATPQHTYQILTKRAERMRDWVQAWSCWLALEGHSMPHNIWLGVSVEHQLAAHERIPFLLETPAAVRFLSCEPLLGPVDLARRWHARNERPPTSRVWLDGLDWIIIGGESGAHARPMQLEWAEQLIHQCRAHSTDTHPIAPFVKQLGQRWYEASRWTGDAHQRHGADPIEWPRHLRIREFPTIATTTPPDDAA